MDPVQTAFNLASDLDKQILTLATGVLALSITFRKEFDNAPGFGSKFFLFGSWIFLLLSVCAGLFTMGKLVSLSLRADSVEKTSVLNDAMPFASTQEILFFLGILFILIYGWVVGARKKPREPVGRAASRE